MNIRKKQILRALTAVSLGVLVCSCSQDEIVGTHGEALPAGKYPLMFTATVDGMISRAAQSAPWGDGDEIAVQIDDYPAIGSYVLNEDGSVKESDNPLSWPYTEGCVKAWYPYVKLGETLEKNIVDQSAGFHDIDFLYAATGETNYKATVDLNFKHQMAKVSCKLIKGDGVTDEDLTTAKVSYAGYPIASFKEGTVTGSYLEGKNENEWISSTSDHSALLVPQDVSDNPFITLDLTLTINGAKIPKTLVFTPEEGTLQLEAGKAYTFNIKVQKDHLEVQTISGAWTEAPENSKPTSDKYQIYLPEDTGDLGELEFSPNVKEGTAVTRAGSVRCLEVLGDYFTISYKVTFDNCHLGPVFASKETLNEVKRTYYEINRNTVTASDNPTDDTTENPSSSVGYYEFSYKIVSPIGEPVYLKIGEHIEIGDILFQDGTWGSIPVKYYKKYEEEPGKYNYIKTPVGIVFKVGAGGATKNALDVPSDYGWDDSREIRGYAVALTDASRSRLTWGPTTTLVSIYAYNEENKQIIKYSGISATNKAKSEGINNYPAFNAAITYTTAAPPGSSDWYLPSYSQLHDVYNLFLHPQRRALLTDAGGDLFQPEYAYCSATERAANMVWTQCFLYYTSSPVDSNTNTNNKYTKTKTYRFFVRSVLTLSKSAEKKNDENE